MKIRPPYGGLMVRDMAESIGESMAAVREIPGTMEALVEFLNMGDGYMNGEITPEMVRLSYVAYVEYNNEPGWNTYAVFVNDTLVAFTDGPVTS